MTSAVHTTDVALKIETVQISSDKFILVQIRQVHNSSDQIQARGNSWHSPVTVRVIG